ncbi:MAG: LLM class flavin-dependent oxidoreductase [Armatimonadota bacterium]|nr:LLM class flavin-dependent oxidoreductase [Armatimonadota bacterium]MDR5703198.1 LLM class flavin-dependent oxidoreductase [Armatimonadota bacterium]
MDRRHKHRRAERSANGLEERHTSMIRVSWLLLGKSLRDLEEQAIACEEAGLDGVWWMDHQGPGDPEGSIPELTVTLALLTRATVRLFIGTLVTDVHRRHPMITAHAFATLSHLAPGRVILGLGAGGGTSHFPFGIALDAPASRLREGIEVIRLLWQATPATPAEYQGKFFQLHRAALPILPRELIPIYVAAYGPRMLRIAGEMGDGWIPEAHTPNTYREARAHVEVARLRQPSGKPFDWCVALIFYPFGMEKEERQGILPAAKIMLAFYPDILRRLLPSGVPEGIHSHHVAADTKLWKQLADLIPDEIALQTVLLGPPDTCLARIREYLQAGCRHVILEPYWGMSSAQIPEAINAAGAIRASLQDVDRI